MAIYYIQHSNSKVFELKLEPIQVDRPQFTRLCLDRTFETVADKHALDIQLLCDEMPIASAILHVEDQKHWACGDGLWMTMRGCPSQC